MAAEDDFLNAFRKLKEQQRSERKSYAQSILDMFEATNADPSEVYRRMMNEHMAQKIHNAFNPGAQGIGGQTIGGQPKTEKPKWNNLAEMNAYIKAHPPKAKPRQKTTAERRTDIEQELDIIRGRVPTPKGYKVDTLRAKALMAELKQLL